MRTLGILLCLVGFLLACKQSKTDAVHKSVVASEQTVPQQEDSVELTPAIPEPIPLDYDSTEWKEILADETTRIELAYASDTNFMKRQIYECGRCFVRPIVYQQFKQVQADLKALGYGIVLLDCHRPRPAQQALWDIMPDARYVTPPNRGSMHNRGHAIDLSLFDLKTNKILDMGSPFDYFGPESHYAYAKLDPAVIKRRQDLRKTMEASGFSGIRTEWWHFSYKKSLKALSDWTWSCP